MLEQQHVIDIMSNITTATITASILLHCCN